MLLDLRAVVEQPGASAPFSYRLCLPDMSFPFGQPFAQPIKVSGLVRNTAGLLTLQAELRTVLHLTCDRCGAAYTEAFSLPADLTLSETLSGAEDDEYFLIQGGRLDLDEALTPLLVLSMETKHLCTDDCLGLCVHCGRSLNEGPCDCADDR